MVFNWFWDWLRDKLNKTPEKKIQRLELDSIKRLVTIEFDWDRRLSVNQFPVKDGYLIWGQHKNPESGQMEVVRTRLDSRTAKPLKGSNTPAFLCIYGIPISVDISDLSINGTSGEALVDWQQFSRRINALLDEKSLINQQQARIELLGQKKSPLASKKVIAIIILVLLVVTAIYLTVINPGLLAGFWKGFGQSAQRVLAPK